MRAPEDPPWTIAWTSEQAFRVQRSLDFPGMMELDQRQAPGEGEPLFAVMHVTRQRRGIVELLCHVCGAPTSANDRYIFPTASGGLVTLNDGSQQFGCNIPPMHRLCAEQAQAVCPHLSRLHENPLKCGFEEGRVIARTDITPGLVGVAAKLPRDADVVLSCYRLYEPAFTRCVIEAREEWEAAVRRRRDRRS